MSSYRTILPHVCFEADDLDAALLGRELLIAPVNPVPELRTAFIVHEGAPIVFLEIIDIEQEGRK